jgi:hypothetical protein
MADETKKRTPNVSAKYKTWIESAFAADSGPWLTTARWLLAAYNGFYHAAYARRHRFVVNTIYSLVHLLLPNLLFRAPYIRVKARASKYFKKLPDGSLAPRDVLTAAKIREAAINHEYLRVAAVDEQRKALFDSFFYGFGIVKAGYSYETVSDMDTDYVVKDTCFLKRVDPRDFGWHPLATDMDDSPFFAQRLYLPKERAARLYGVDKIKLNKVNTVVPEHIKKRLAAASANRKGTADGPAGLPEAEGAEYVSLCELHDVENKKIVLWDAGGKVQLSDVRPDPYDFAGSHFTRVKLAGDNEAFEGRPVLSTVLDQALVLNELFTLMIEHVRKFPAQLFVGKGSVDEDDIERIRSGEQGSVHVVAEPEKIITVPPVSMGADYQLLVRLIQDVIDRTLGVTDFMRGNASGRRSATEASLLHGDATARREYFLDLVKDFILGGIRRLAWLQEQYQDKRLEIMASGDPQGDPITYDKTDIQGDWAYELDVENLRASNEVQLNTLINLVGTLGKAPVTEPVIASINPMKLGAMLFRLGGMHIQEIQYSLNDPNMDRVFGLIADRLLASAAGATGAPGAAPPAGLVSAPEGAAVMGPGTGQMLK